MYQYKSGLLPYSFNNMFLVTHQFHSYGTRSSELFYLHQCRTNIRKFSISFQGPKFFNSSFHGDIITRLCTVKMVSQESKFQALFATAAILRYKAEYKESQLYNLPFGQTVQVASVY